MLYAKFHSYGDRFMALGRLFLYGEFLRTTKRCSAALVQSVPHHLLKEMGNWEKTLPISTLR